MNEEMKKTMINNENIEKIVGGVTSSPEDSETNQKIETLELNINVIIP